MKQPFQACISKEVKFATAICKIGWNGVIESPGTKIEQSNTNCVRQIFHRQMYQKNITLREGGLRFKTYNCTYIQLEYVQIKSLPKLSTQVNLKLQKQH